MPEVSSECERRRRRSGVGGASFESERERELRRAEPRDDDSHYFTTVAGCQASCLLLTNCEAVVVSAPANGLVACWRRRNVHVERCQVFTDSSYDTYVMVQAGG